MVPATAVASKYEFRQHLRSLGFEVGETPERIHAKLRQCLGAERGQEYERLQREALARGADGQNDIYDFMQTLQEANLLRCLNTDVTLDTSYFLYERAVPYLQPGTEVLELGCWTAGLASFVAEHHPDCAVTGADRAKQIVNLNRGLYKLPNLSFAEWDYRASKPAGIPQADLLLCGLGTTYACPSGAYDRFDPSDIRSSQGYEHEFKEALLYFKSWREAAKPGARLMAVLRAQTFPRFVAFLDAARRAGWTPVLNEFTYVGCEANKERLPFFSFVAKPCSILDEDLVLALLVRMADTKDNLGEIEGPAALAMYRSLRKKRLRSEQGKNQSGAEVWVEIGHCDAFAYIFTRDSAPNFKLSLLPRWKADELIALLEQSLIKQPPACAQTVSAQMAAPPASSPAGVAA